MEAESVLNLFDSKWFHLGILETRQKISTANPSAVSRQISKSDELSSLTRQNNSPDSALRPHLQTILSDKPAVKKGVRRHERRKKSLSELEFEEVKGFVDIGFVFSEEDKEDPELVEIIPGLHKLGKKDEEASRMRARPYLSEAWDYEEPLMKWRIPLPAPATNQMDIKDSLKSWAHTVASAVR